uniref:Reverse transcriptase domain-containing protein n=1 Tax=Caenorhabditis tropicalis TaxID=1561998 RepID=A0A1I7TRJ3_9PELO
MSQSENPEAMNEIAASQPASDLLSTTKNAPPRRIFGPRHPERDHPLARANKNNSSSHLTGSEVELYVNEPWQGPNYSNMDGGWELPRHLLINFIHQINMERGIVPVDTKPPCRVSFNEPNADHEDGEPPRKHYRPSEESLEKIQEPLGSITVKKPYSQENIKRQIIAELGIARPNNN